MSRGERRAIVERDDPDVPIAAECRLLNVARSTLYYQPTPVDPDDLALMRRMDELYTKWPFYGSRRMVAALRQDGLNVNRKRAHRVMGFCQRSRRCFFGGTRLTMWTPA